MTITNKKKPNIIPRISNKYPFKFAFNVYKFDESELYYYFLACMSSHKGYLLPAYIIRDFSLSFNANGERFAFSIKPDSDEAIYKDEYKFIKEYLIDLPPDILSKYSLALLAEKKLLSDIKLDDVIAEDIIVEKEIEKFEESLSNPQNKYTANEGALKLNYVRTYERNPKLRAEAIRIHKLTCMACGFNFEETYGEYGKNYIEVHHIVPVSELIEETEIDPEKGMVVLCSNCHKITHRKRDKVLSLDELKQIIIK